MHSKILLVLCACLLCFVSLPSALALPDDIKAESYVTGLLFPIAMAPTPEGDILVTEKFGSIRLIRDHKLLEEPLARVEVETKNEAGLLGVAVFPDFETSRAFVVSYTPAKDLDSIFVSKYTLPVGATKAVLEEERWLVLPSNPETDRHYGGNMVFANGYFYMALSDLLINSLPADTSHPAGSILRYNEDLSIPEDNPIGPDNPIYAYGLRNTFDFAVAPDGTIFGGENGQDMHDEFNQIEPGNFYGWPYVFGKCDQIPILETCTGLVAEPVDPVYEWPYNVGPTGALVYTGDLMPSLKGQVFIAGWHSGEVHDFKRTASGIEVNEEIFFVMPGGAIEFDDGDNTTHLTDGGLTDITQADDGAILVMVSSMSGGRIMRIAPADMLLDPAREVQNGPIRRNQNVPPNNIIGACAQGSTPTPGLPWTLAFASLLGAALLRNRRARAWMVAGAASASLLALAPADAHATDTWGFGPKLGVGNTYINGNNVHHKQWAQGPSVGAAGRWMPFGWLGLGADALYTLEGVNIEGVEQRLSLHYLTVPLTVHAALPVFSWAQPRLFVGSSFKTLLHASVGDEDKTQYVSGVDVGIQAGLGVDVPILEGRGTLDFWVERGTIALPDQEAAGDVPVGESRTIALQLLFGYLF